MPLQINNNGQNNEIAIADSIKTTGIGEISLNGDNNAVAIASTSYSFGGKFAMGSRCSLTIGHNVNCRNLFIHMSNDCKVIIGSGTSFNGLVRLLLHESGIISIGEGCLIADQVDISLSDMHSVITLPSRRRINPAENVTIGDYVWIAQRSTILKGVQIGRGSIVGASAVVTRPIPENSLAVGNPADVVKSDVTWDIRLLEQFQ